MTMVSLFGITGHIASGKSSVVKIFRRHGFAIVDIDGMLDDIFKPGTNVHKEILETFGTEIIKLDGSIDTARLSILMCNEKWAAEVVGQLVEDEIDNIIYRIKNAFIATGIEFGGIESNTIFGTRLEKHMKRIVAVTCLEDNILIQRLMNRSRVPFQMAKRIIDSSRNFGFDKADFVIDNSGSLEELTRVTEKIMQELVLELRKV